MSHYASAVDDHYHCRNVIIANGAALTILHHRAMCDKSPTTLIDAMRTIVHDMNKAMGIDLVFRPAFVLGDGYSSDGEGLTLRKRRRRAIRSMKRRAATVIIKRRNRCACGETKTG